MNHKRTLVAQALSSTLLGKYLLELVYRYSLLQHYVISIFNFIGYITGYNICSSFMHSSIPLCGWIKEVLLGVIENKGVIKNNTQWFSYQTISIHQSFTNHKTD